MLQVLIIRCYPIIVLCADINPPQWLHPSGDLPSLSVAVAGFISGYIVVHYSVHLSQGLGQVLQSDAKDNRLSSATFLKQCPNILARVMEGCR